MMQYNHLKKNESYYYVLNPYKSIKVNSESICFEIITIDFNIIKTTKKKILFESIMIKIKEV